MIGFLRGEVELVSRQQNYLDVILMLASGVGYRVRLIGVQTVLPLAGEQLALYIYHQQSDSGQQLWGMAELKQLILFEKLLAVNGVGPAAASAIISALTPDDFYNKLILAELAKLKIKGVGHKTLQKIEIDLPSRLKDHIGQSQTAAVNRNYSVTEDAVVADAYDALKSLGYNRAEVDKILSRADGLETAEQYVSYFLKHV